MTILKDNQFKKAFVNLIYHNSLQSTKKELQDQLFFSEETTDSWSIQQCRIQHVKDQVEFIEGGNLEQELDETWELVFNNKEYGERK
tara:strand:+ start:595 stop:855 length:261 start_codon:yes stop_codon:yes gene_type:complete